MTAVPSAGPGNEQTAAVDVCARTGCHHPRSSHSYDDKCTEVNTYLGMKLFGLEQGPIRKLCGCTFSEPDKGRRAVVDGPQA